MVSIKTMNLIESAFVIVSYETNRLSTVIRENNSFNAFLAASIYSKKLEPINEICPI